MARRANQRVVIIRGVRYRGGVNVVVVKAFAGVLNAFRGKQHLSRPRDILMAQARLETEAVLTNKIVTIDIQPVTCRNLRESSAFLTMPRHS